MGSWHDAAWDSRIKDGLPQRERRSGTYRWHLPTPLTGLPVVIPPALDRQLADAERAVRTLAEGPDREDLFGLARFLLRSEAIASSRIEGIAPGAKHVALAELAEQEQISGFSAQAELVARNMTLVQDASSNLASTNLVTLDSLIALHSALLADEPRHHGLRQVQNWIGGSNHHPLDADFVPPSPEQVPELMDDLVCYLNGATHAPLLQAALVHAQFETIHPFTDGNGRMGRALIHTVLARRGLTPTAVLPISLVLATFRDDYIRGLTAYRHDAAPHSSTANQSLTTWLQEFATATIRATQQADELREDIRELRQDWQRRVEELRARQGRQRTMRSDSATGLILADLPSTPVLTATTVQRIHKVSAVAAGRALTELHEAGIMEPRSAGRGVRAYIADEVLDLITATERRLASTKFDTRVSAPNRDVPVHP